MKIPVTADGYVHVGNNQWASLAQIQNAVELRQNPSLDANCGRDEEPRTADELLRQFQHEVDRLSEQSRNMNPRLRRRLQRNAQEDHLPLPRMVFNKTESEQPKQTRNEDAGEHLPLPSWPAK